jgi:hypothetical protein
MGKRLEMKSIVIGAAALLLGAVAVNAPASATVYDWTLDAGGGLTGSGILVTGAPAGSGFDVVSFTGSIGGSPVSLLGGQPGGQATSPSGAFYYDNTVMPTSDPVFDVNGLLFTVDAEEGNIWGNGVAGSYSYWTHVGSSYDYTNGSVVFSLTAARGVDFARVAAPEPASIATLGVGFLGLIWARRRSTKTITSVQAS